MKDIKKFKNRLIVAIVSYIVIFAALGWLIGDSYLLAVGGIVGWIVLFLFLVKYIAISRQGKKS